MDGVHENLTELNSKLSISGSLEQEDKQEKERVNAEKKMKYTWVEVSLQQ